MGEVHSRLAASTASRWIRCPGSLALIDYLKKEQLIPESRTNFAAEKGTACHSILEHCIITHTSPSQIGPTLLSRLSPNIKLDQYDLINIEVYWTYIEKQRRMFDETFAEKRYDLSGIYGVDLGGTADITQCQQEGTLHIGDYKNGKTVVNVENNYQLRIYALGAYYEFDDIYKFQDIKTTIGQPNAYHRDGPVRAEAFTISDLKRFEEQQLIPAVELIKDNTADLRPGTVQCEWCDAREHCEANNRQLSVIMKQDFLGKEEKAPVVDFDAKLLTAEQIINVLDNKTRIIKTLESIEARAIELAKDGKLGNYVLENKPGKRQLKEKSELKAIAVRKKIPYLGMFKTPEKKLRNLTEMQEYLSKERKMPAEKVKRIMDELTTKGPGKQVLVKRPSTAKRDFADVVKDTNVRYKARKAWRTKGIDNANDKTKQTKRRNKNRFRTRK